MAATASLFLLGKDGGPVTRLRKCYYWGGDRGPVSVNINTLIGLAVRVPERKT